MYGREAPIKLFGIAESLRLCDSESNFFLKKISFLWILFYRENNKIEKVISAVGSSPFASPQLKEASYQSHRLTRQPQRRFLLLSIFLSSLILFFFPSVNCLHRDRETGEEKRARKWRTVTPMT